mmetsp:Transcript_19183/g.44900  ORF Transcript_19183/g.44900 Transcript_19183/m.44900 type:complete len:90 (-) Transcript_19183:810-1079(-)
MYQCTGCSPHSLDLLSTVLKYHTSNSGQMGRPHITESSGTVTAKLTTPVIAPVKTASGTERSLLTSIAKPTVNKRSNMSHRKIAAVKTK